MQPRTIAHLATLGLGAMLASIPASAQVRPVRPGEPGPDLSGYEQLRHEIAAGHDAVRARRGAGGRPTILLTGYWPPSNEMIRHFSDNPTQNPDGWMGDDWEGRGYDVYAFFPEFPAGPAPGCDWGQGLGDLEVDYQDTSDDFWRIVAQVEPSAIITFSRGDLGDSWEVELLQRNSVTWVDDDSAPFQPTPAPPEASYPANQDRCSTLPMQDIVDRVNATVPEFSAFIDQTGGGGNFLSEFIAYHGVWYRALHETLLDPTRTFAAGHVHLGFTRCSHDPTQLMPYVAAAEETLRTLIELLDAGQEVPPTGVSATSTGPDEVTLSWNGTSPLYRVFRADGGCSEPLQLVGETPVPTFIDIAAIDGQSYGYVIRSVDLCNADSECIEYPSMTCDAAALNRIEGLTVVKGAAGSLELSWNDDPAAPPEYHVNSVLTKAELETPNRGLPSVTTECTVITTACEDPDALSQPGLLLYQVLSACSDTVGEEGPF